MSFPYSELTPKIHHLSYKFSFRQIRFERLSWNLFSTKKSKEAFMLKSKILTILLVLAASVGIVYAALIVPTEIEQPGTQPREVGNLESPDKCDNCHGGYNQAVEPAFNWRGSMMANAARDPIFWATLAIAEQDFDGAGDLCIRCHSTGGWYAGRSTPAEIKLLYQPTSWEYVQFLYRANNRNNLFLADEGDNLLNAWLGTGMAEPYLIASATWGTVPAPQCSTPGTPQNLIAEAGRRSVTLNWPAGDPAPIGGYRIYYIQSGKLQFLADVDPTVLTYKDNRLTRQVTYTYVLTGWNDCNSNGIFDAGIDTESAVSNQASATAQ